MKKLIVGTSVLILNLSGLAFSQSNDTGSKISISILLNQVSDPRYRLSVGLEAAYNLSRKMSLVLNYFNSKNTSSDRVSKTNLTINYFLLVSRINLTEKAIKFFFETGPVLLYYTKKVEGTAERYNLISTGSERERYDVVSYQYSNSLNSRIRVGVSLGAGAEILLSSALSALVKGDQMLLPNPTSVLNNIFSFSAGLKYNF